MRQSAAGDRAGVSQPSVTRFCRALGCDSVRDFKFKLAQNLAVGSSYLKQPERLDDDVAHLASRVINCIIDGVVLARDQLDHQALRRAIEIIAEIRRLDIYGVGGASHSVGLDAYLRFFASIFPAPSMATPICSACRPPLWDQAMPCW